MRVGLISDTHGLVRPDVAAALKGVDLILHAGDVGSRDVLAELETIAPVAAVSGNVDPMELMLPPTIVRDLEHVCVFVTHGNELGSPTPEKLAAKYRADVIVFGHTHKAVIRRVSGTLVVNPGAAGPRRFTLLPSVGVLTLDSGSARVDILTLSA